MYSFKIQFFSVADDIGFIMKSSIKEDVSNFVNDLLSIFVTLREDGKPLLNCLQEYSEENKKGLLDFIDKYSPLLPQLKSLSTFLKKLNPKEFFLFLPNMDLEQIETLKLNEYLHKINSGVKYETPSKELLDLYDEFLKKYQARTVGKSRIKIGKKNKEKRICRFCSNKNNPTTFNSKAHAISEALGNKTVLLFDECDECNNEFSETIEPHIIQYLSLFRTIFGVKGKGGNKKIKGKNFTMHNDGQVNIDFINIDDRPSDSEENYNLKLNLQEPIVFQNVYKSFCKFFLSVIDDNLLIHFQDTIKWIKGEIEISNLPKIAELTTYDNFTLQPILSYYIRKDDDESTPFAVCKFVFTCRVYVFIIPLSNRDSLDFCNESEFKHYWRIFKPFNKKKNWSFNDYSNNTPKDFTINLSHEINQKSNDG